LNKTNIIIDEKIISELPRNQELVIRGIGKIEYDPIYQRLSNAIKRTMSTTHYVWKQVKKRFDIELTIKFTPKK